MDIPSDTQLRHASRRWLPRSFYARAALILILPIIVLQLAVAVMFLQRHYEDVTIQMTSNLARSIELVRDRPDLGDALEIEAVAAPARTRVRIWDLSARAMRESLMSRFDDLVAVDTVSERKRVIMGFADGTGLRISRTDVSASNPHQLLVLMMVTSLLMTAVSFLFMRGQIRPIRRLATAAEAFGRGQSAPYRPAGATEVRAAGTAFLDMRHRIERHIEQRTLLLSGVSHDLRTPLTRMKLELSMMDGPEAEALGEDVSAMERIIDTFLDFARESATDERAQTDLRPLLQDVVDQAAPGAGITVDGPDLRIALYPESVRRAVSNLVTNAQRYGTQTRVWIHPSGTTVVIGVEDDGPGIAEADRAAATRPFARLETARSNTSGNVGLGLSIVQDVARAHGGSLRLGTSDLGGLKAEIVIPN